MRVARHARVTDDISAPRSSGSAARRTVLVVDDEAGVRDAVRIVLENDCEVLHAATA